MICVCDSWAEYNIVLPIFEQYYEIFTHLGMLWRAIS